MQTKACFSNERLPVSQRPAKCLNGGPESGFLPRMEDTANPQGIYTKWDLLSAFLAGELPKSHVFTNTMCMTNYLSFALFGLIIGITNRHDGTLLFSWSQVLLHCLDCTAGYNEKLEICRENDDQTGLSRISNVAAEASMQLSTEHTYLF